MSTQTLPIAGVSEWEPIPTAAAERVQQLQELIAQVEHPSSTATGSTAPAAPAGSTFASALDAAQEGGVPATGLPATGLPTVGAYDAVDGYPSTAAYPSTGAYPSPGIYPPAGTYPSAGTYSTAGTSDAAYLATPGGSEALTSNPGVSGAATPYLPLIDQAAGRYGINPALLYGLIQQESGFDPSAHSSAGALGLTQLMPSTAASLGVTEPLDPEQSIAGGARYLSQLLHQFSGNATDALAAYNAGAGAVQQYGGVPPYPETQQYVTKVLGYAAAYPQVSPSAPTSISAGPVDSIAAGPVDATTPTYPESLT